MEVPTLNEQDFDLWEAETLDAGKYRKNRLGIAGINFKMLSHVMGKAAFAVASPEVVPVIDTPESPPVEQAADTDDNIESMVVLSESS